ncbi:hypothetical protein PCANC_28361 [Puccinia coronata f. sp. avenae]|uniref:Uncharacterized protein n=1 Tax=Puccinia coronata f. sp. avenae TaxID=200324 RepID=A0A2N5TLC0_9BASI|nr:hypothetical protein PCANC_28361 [Puccinia coronata f. sp. avenae]PLW26297.1 hypothetical protein PCASD_26344 [Puccinia coronata f. sp. avenae]
MKIFLAIHEIKFPSHPMRSSWTKAYNLICREQVSLNGSSLMPKKRKTNALQQVKVVIPPRPSTIPPKSSTRKSLPACKQDMRIKAIKAKKQLRNESILGSPSSSFTFTPLVSRPVQSGTQEQVAALTSIDGASQTDNKASQTDQATQSNHEASPSDNNQLAPLVSRPVQSGTQEQVAALASINKASPSDNDQLAPSSNPEPLAHSSHLEPEAPATPARRKRHCPASDPPRPASSLPHPPSPATSPHLPSPARSSNPQVLPDLPIPQAQQFLPTCKALQD